MDLPPVIVDGRTRHGSSSRVLAAYRKVELGPGGAPKRVYWTVVWDDERWRPGALGKIFDVGYQTVRRFQYGRSADIEDLHYDLDASGNIESIHFVGTYAGGRNYWSIITEHYSRKIEASEIVWDPQTGRPVVFSATWTHLMHNRPEHRLSERAAAARRVVREYPIKEGGRERAEADYKIRVVRGRYEFPNLGQRRAFDLTGNITLDAAGDNANTSYRHFGPESVVKRDRAMHDLLFVAILAVVALVVSVAGSAVADRARKRLVRDKVATEIG